MELIIIFWLICAGLGMIIANAKNRSLAEGFFLSLLCGIFGVLIEALLPKQLPKPPRGLTAVSCPRCSAAQNVPDPQSYECWQCHLTVGPPPAPAKPIPVLEEKRTLTCPGCKARLKVPANSTKKRFRCYRCGDDWPMPVSPRRDPAG